MPDPEPFGPCPICHHHLLLHCGEEGKCVVRLLKSGYNDFASLPQCGCTYKQPEVEKEVSDVQS